MPSPRRRRWTGALATTTACVVGLSVFSAVPAFAAPRDSLIVTEILGDTVSYDDFEYFEVHNPTAAPIGLAANGVTLSYIFADSADVAQDKLLTPETDITIAPGETVLFWLSYTTATVDSFGKTVEQFRTAHGVSADTQVVRVTGQGGIANSGERGIRVSTAADVSSWSYVPAGGFSVGNGATFRLAAAATDLGLDVLAAPTAPSPGTIAPETLAPTPTPQPDPEPDPLPDPEPLPGTPQPDPALTTSRLQVTELLPDSANVGGGDGYEFVELYNATTEPIPFSDYTISYLYATDVDTNSSVALWPATPNDPVIAPGGTLVLWVKNAGNQQLTAADFNAKFGTNLAAGEELVEIQSGGMANGGPRGIAVTTNTGFTENRAYYWNDAETVADQGIQYAVDPADVTLQKMLGIAPASPGVVGVDQVPAGLMVEAADTVAPTVTDHTAETIDPAADFTIDLEISDAVQVRTVEVTFGNDVDSQTRTVSLTHAGDDRYRYAIPAADLMGKAWYEYTVRVSDGSQQVTTPAKRVGLDGVDTSAVRLNLTDGDYVAGTEQLIAAGDRYPSELEIAVGDTALASTPSLEAEPMFVFEAEGINDFFKNGVRIGDEVLSIFDKSTPSGYQTLTTTVPLDYVVQGDELVVSVWAGTKAAPEIDLDENNDDFKIRGLRLVLPDGRTLTPAGYDDPATVLSMGDSAGLRDFYDARFTLPADAFSAVAAEWDTTTTEDGSALVAATDGVDSASRTVLVDNTAPVVETQIVDGTPYQGEISIEPEVTDAGSGVASVAASLDGQPIEVPYTTSSLDLTPGEHLLTVAAADEVGNTTDYEVTFTTYDEYPLGGAILPADGATVEAGDVTLQAEVSDPAGDLLDVQFLEGQRLDLATGEVSLRSGTVNDALTTERGDTQTLSRADVDALATRDGIATEVTSDAEFPYQLFEVAVPSPAAEGTEVRVTWNGSANDAAQVRMYALTADGTGWSEVARHTASADEPFTLEAFVDVAAHERDGRVQVLVQHSEGFAGENLTTRDSAVTPHNPGDVPRSEYDFSFGWMSDTQYYNEEFVEHQVAINDFFVDRREELNLQYVFHTGDIVDDWNQPYQWQNADPQYQKFDDAGLPYGVLAGNHDVGGHEMDYSVYGEYFGEERFDGNPWYGGSYQDNRGHFDLISAGGIDFVMVYTGWGSADEEIAWMNEVLAQYPDRVGIVAQHEFILTTGGLGEIPQRILDEVVETNPNVKMVFSGHYHDAYTRTDAFDDTGDGVPDRTVYSMLFDYQGLVEGGQGFLRLLHFDNEGQRMMVRTYSPSLDQYNSDEASLLGPPEDPWVFQEFELGYDQLGVTPGVRTLATDAFSAEILTASEIASFDDVASGSVVTATWPIDEPGEYGWYVRSTDPFGAVDLSTVREFTVVPAAVEPGVPGDDDGNDDAGSGGGSGADGSGADTAGGATGTLGGGDRGDRDRLANTGADSTGTFIGVGAALLLILGGLGAVLIRRRRAS